ncbi:hypothetical protein Pph01_47170 [Planotetraspora phitsanulokensis]|uniref:Uncharacterized protein n=1 Tax=Planotetraspora phitsanulokensis TaxID=575192 RepID=A0A8J3U6U9_9ACTN|nr:hypothetical protein Pph01_47170 [Planotetraspora phitsanulokensis]
MVVRKETRSSYGMAFVCAQTAAAARAIPAAIPVIRLTMLPWTCGLGAGRGALAGPATAITRAPA